MSKISDADVKAWMHEEDPSRVISASQKRAAVRDGGASATSVKNYTIPLSYLLPSLAGQGRAAIKDAYIRHFGRDGGWLGGVGFGFMEGYQAALAARQPVELIAKKIGDYRVTVAEDAITVSHGRDIVFAYTAGDAEPIIAQPLSELTSPPSGFMTADGKQVAHPADATPEYSIPLYAARQPVGQEPMAWLIHWTKNEGGPEATTKASRAEAVGMLTNSPRIEPLYAAPPAQAVDLEQFRRPVETWKRKRERSLRQAIAAGKAAPLVEGLRRNVADADRLLAVIDSSKAVQS